jgi:hypothetical protein
MIGTLPEHNRLLEIGPILRVTRFVPCISNRSGLSSNKLAFAVRVPLCTSLRRNEILTRNCGTGPDYFYLAMQWPSLKHSGLDAAISECGWTVSEVYTQTSEGTSEVRVRDMAIAVTGRYLVTAAPRVPPVLVPVRGILQLTKDGLTGGRNAWWLSADKECGDDFHLGDGRLHSASCTVVGKRVENHDWLD